MGFHARYEWIRIAPWSPSTCAHGRLRASSGRKPVQNVRTALGTAAKRAGLTRNGKPYLPTIKLFRKAFATMLAEQGTNQSVVGAMMGHAPGSKMTDQYYTFVRDAAKRANRVSLLNLASRESKDTGASGNFGQR